MREGLPRVDDAPVSGPDHDDDDLGDLEDLEWDEDDELEDLEDLGDPDEDAPRISRAELDDIERAALSAIETKNVKFLAPPDLVLRLVRSHRRTSDESLRSHLDWSEAADVRQDFAESIVRLRQVLKAIAQADERDDHKTALRMRALAKKALEGEEQGDRSMQAEFGYTIDNFTAYELPKNYFEELPMPKIGEFWEDDLGGQHRVVEVDETEDAVKLEIVRPVGWVEQCELFAHGRRVEPPDPGRDDREDG